MFRSMLAAVKPTLSDDPFSTFAISLAERHRLTIDACAVIDPGQLTRAEAVPLGASAFKVHRDEQILETARRQAADLSTRLGEMARARAIPCSLQILEGNVADILAESVQRCDFLLCGHRQGGKTDEKSALFTILKQCPRPALVVPHTEVLGQEVLVAYDGSTQAARTLASFVASGLTEGRAVHIASFDEGSGKAASHAAAAQEFLRRHGISSEVHIEPMAHNVGDQILRRAEALAVALVVMGAFGRGKVQEFFFGSATRSVLQKLPVATFIDQ